MKKPLLKDKTKQALLSFGKGLLMNATGYGPAKTGVKAVAAIGLSVAQSVKDLSSKNKASKVSGEGNADPYHWVGVAVGLVISLTILGVSVYAFMTGQISFSELIKANL